MQDIGASCGRIPTGDLKGNATLLHSELRRIKYNQKWDSARWLPCSTLFAQLSRWLTCSVMQGSPAVLLPMLHFAALSFSKHVSEPILKACPIIAVRTDLRFVQALLGLLRDEWSYFAQLSAAQFTGSTGYAERKVILVCEVIQRFRQHHQKHSFRQRTRDPSRRGSPSSSRWLPALPPNAY